MSVDGEARGLRKGDGLRVGETTLRRYATATEKAGVLLDIGQRLSDRSVETMKRILLT